MRFAALFAGLAVISSVAALPVEDQLLTKAKALAKRNRAGLRAGTLSKRNNTGTPAITDADILNFALQLEYLEAQYYHIAAYGTQLDQSLLGGTGNRGYVSGNAGKQVPFASDAVRQYAVEIANDEMNHVKALRAALGSAAVAQPEINLSTSFTAAARAAGIIGANATFDPFSSDANFITGAYLFEDVGVTAYNGAAPLITSKAFLAAAAGILAVEAYHASEIRTLLFTAGGAAIDAANKAAVAIGSLDSGKAQGIQVNGTANIVPADANSIAFARTPGQVANIVFLSPEVGVTKGGFFPNGLNGPLNAGVGAGK